MPSLECAYLPLGRTVGFLLSTEKATGVIEPQTETSRMIDRVRRAGYDVALGEASFRIENMSDNADALTIEFYVGSACPG